jgi:hypothetical protein
MIIYVLLLCLASAPQQCHATADLWRDRTACEAEAAWETVGAVVARCEGRKMP